MTLKIEIEAHPDFGDLRDQVDRAMSALGYHRASGTKPGELKTAEAAADRYDGLGTAMQTASEAAEQEPAQETATEAEKLAPLDTRPVGSPAEGNKRRNSTEKAEDDKLEAMAAERNISLDNLNKVVAEHGRARAVEEMEQIAPNSATEEVAAISTGEERVGPEDDPETDAQDAADEAAETAANGGLAPIDELRRAVGDYQKKFGMPAAVALCQEGGLIGCGVHELPEADIPAMVAKVRAAVDADKPADDLEIPASLDRRGELAEKQVEQPKATKVDLQKAMLRYAKKFDGQDADMNAMPFTMEDCPKIFTLLFGEGVTKLSQVPETGYAEAIAGIDEAIQKNPFKR